MTLSITSPVGHIAAAAPGSIRIFERFGLDYCCGGKLSLAQACERKGLDPRVVLAEIELAAQTPPDHPEIDWAQRPVGDLVDHLIQTHHAYLRENMGRLAELAEKVARVHGDNHPELLEVRRVYLKFMTEMQPHLEKEEFILFPAIARPEHAGFAPPLAGPIAVMEAEHDEVGRDLTALRALTHDYEVPEDACTSYRLLMAGLAELEQDTLAHVHKENNLLFPRALEAPAVR